MICELEGCSKQARRKYCSDAHRQKAYRHRRAEKMKLVQVVETQPNEPCLPLDAHQSNRIADLFKNCQFWLDDFLQSEIDEIKGGPRWWLHRWTRSLNAWGLMGQAKGIIYQGSETRFEEQYRTDDKFRLKVKKETRTYQDLRGMARIKAQ